MKHEVGCIVTDVVEAKNIALNHLMVQGIVAFGSEIVSISRRGMIWLVIIEGKAFTGIIIIKSTTGEVVAMIK